MDPEESSRNRIWVLPEAAALAPDATSAAAGMVPASGTWKKITGNPGAEYAGTLAAEAEAAMFQIAMTQQR
jgi:hypothetical protein